LDVKAVVVGQNVFHTQLALTVTPQVDALPHIVDNFMGVVLRASSLAIFFRHIYYFKAGKAADLPVIRYLCEESE